MKRWRHVIVNAHRSWLHGDERGFRSRGHRIHSSGDYKHRPPTDEHRPLWNYQRTRSDDPVEFDPAIRAVIIREFVLKLQALDHPVIACSCSDEHLHALTELPETDDEVRKEIGKCKQKVSHALRDVLPGTIWSAGGEYKRIQDKEHLHATYRYIRTGQEPGTVVWSHRAEEDWIADPEMGFWFINKSRVLERLAST